MAQPDFGLLDTTLPYKVGGSVMKGMGDVNALAAQNLQNRASEMEIQNALAEQEAYKRSASLGEAQQNLLGTAQANALLAAGNARASAYGGYGQAAGQGLQGLYNNWNNISGLFGGNSGLSDANSLIASNPNAAGGQYSVQGNSDYYYDL